MHQAMFDGYMKGIYAGFAAKGQLNLGQLIALLEKFPEDHQVVYDFAGLQPTTLQSYRGYYEHLALGHTREMSYGSMSVVELLRRLKAAVGVTFEGYKGGSYVMGLETPLWVANSGETGGTAIIGAADTGSVVVLLTAYVEN